MTIDLEIDSAALTNDVGHWIGGAQYYGDDDRKLPVWNPATGEGQRVVSIASRETVDTAVEAARNALPEWSETPPAKRAQVMFRFRELLYQNLDAIAELISQEHGKTRADAIGEAMRGIEVVEVACGIPQLLKGEFNDQVAVGVDCFGFRQPVGVCVGITPFNFPAMVPMWMFPMALACGNTFVLKPSERVPSCSIFLARLLKEAGLPDGVMSVVNGDKEAVDVLLTHDGVDAISFVGSTVVGKYIYAKGTEAGKRVQALCGAKNHMIVLPDADIDQAVNAAMGAAYGSAGERCMAISVAVAVGDETADAFVEAMAPKVRALKIGPYTDPSAEMGPVITRDAVQRIEKYVDEGVEQGAELVVDGRCVSLQGYENGFFTGGTLLDRVTPEMSVYRDEIFGPVLSVVRSENFDHAVNLINSHAYGNGSALFTRDGDAARTFVRRVQAGMVGVNVPIPVPVAYHSFGGWKQSLFGDHHIHGPEGVRFYTRLKTVTGRWPSGIRQGVQFNFERGSDV